MQSDEVSGRALGEVVRRLRRPDADLLHLRSWNLILPQIEAGWWAQAGGGDDGCEDRSVFEAFSATSARGVHAGMRYEKGSVVEVSPFMHFAAACPPEFLPYRYTVRNARPEDARLEDGAGGTNMVLGVGWAMRVGSSSPAEGAPRCANVECLWCGRYAVYRALNDIPLYGELVLLSRAGYSLDEYECTHVAGDGGGPYSGHGPGTPIAQLHAEWRQPAGESTAAPGVPPGSEATDGSPRAGAVAREEEEERRQYLSNAMEVSMIGCQLAALPVSRRQAGGGAAALAGDLPGALACALRSWNYMSKSTVSDDAGQGVFAGRDYAAGALVEVNFLITYGGHSDSDPYELHRYAFVSDMEDLFEQDYPRSNMMVGFGSIFNHGGRTRANLEGYALGKVGQYVLFKAKRDIRMGEELLTDYGAVPTC